MGEYVKVMDGGDGGRYASTENIGRVEAKTANFTAKVGGNYSNRGSSGAITVTLPTRATQGAVVRVFRANRAQNITISRGGATANILSGQTPFTGTSATSNTANEGASCVLVGDGTDWFLWPTGTWFLT